MTFVIGTDEAGYGPNLGPLTVAASAWRLDAGVADAEAVFAAMAAALADPGGPLWADSKRLYRAGDGFSELERGVLAALGIVGAAPSGWPTLAANLGQVGPQAGADVGWDHLASLSLPRGTDPAECRTVAARAAPVLKAARVELLGLACRAVYPAEFNRLLDSGLNKSDILSRTTLDLAAELLDRFGPGESTVWCDRHGGRKGYAALVARHFSAPLVQPLEESAARSAYRVPARGVQIEFTVGGESRLPVALASMTAKYVRELAMAAFNMFWSDRLPGLVPTAGYPVDARRWRGDADAAIRAARIPADQLWRRA